uniref:Ig-like domain-containing protein n=1 Tax=Eptatretus burgeri TaxID=7764 RepID=A0A8C4PW56_EPTBU
MDPHLHRGPLSHYGPPPSSWIPFPLWTPTFIVDPFPIIYPHLALWTPFPLFIPTFIMDPFPIMYPHLRRGPLSHHLPLPCIVDPFPIIYPHLHRGPLSHYVPPPSLWTPFPSWQCIVTEWLHSERLNERVVFCVPIDPRDRGTIWRAPLGCSHIMWLHLLHLALLGLAAPATLARGPPRISSLVHGQQRVYLGHNIRLPCPVTGDPPPLTMWTKDGRNINSGWLRFRMLPKSLRIERVERDDAGVYMCKAANGFGSIRINYTLVVIGRKLA